MNTTPPAVLARVRYGVRAVLALGVAASIAANVLHAQPTMVGRAIAAWSPLALLLTVELISRVPVTHRALSGLRMTATATIAGIAAWVSYWHMVSVAARYGEQSTSAHLLPLSVDGLVIVASISLVEIAGRLRAVPGLAVMDHDQTDQQATAGPSAGPAPVPDGGVPGSGGAAEGQAPQVPVQSVTASPVPDPVRPARRSARPSAVSAAVKVARLRERHPDWTVARIAERAGVSERTARRHLNHPAATPDTPAPALSASPAPGNAAPDSGPAASGLAA